MSIAVMRSLGWMPGTGPLELGRAAAGDLLLTGAIDGLARAMAGLVRIGDGDTLLARAGGSGLARPGMTSAELPGRAANMLKNSSVDMARTPRCIVARPRFMPIAKADMAIALEAGAAAPGPAAPARRGRSIEGSRPEEAPPP